VDDKAELERLLLSELFESVQAKITTKRKALATQFGILSGRFVREIVNLELSGLGDLLEGNLDIILRVYFYERKPREDCDEELITSKMKKLFEQRLIASRTSLENNLRLRRERTQLSNYETEAGHLFHSMTRKIRALILENRIKLPELPDRDAIDLIAQEEDNQIEFKSTFQWDKEKECRNKDLKIEVIKTIAAFNNTDGGYLIIGVSDNKQIFGLERDFDLLGRQDKDGFCQALTQEIENSIGRSFTTKPNISFKVVEEKCICLIKINIGHEPAWVSVGNRFVFYIRTQNSTRELDPKEASEHILKKWGK
jgi:hypothetical protein